MTTADSPVVEDVEMAAPADEKVRALQFRRVACHGVSCH
jgi:hypothetical protein